MENLCSSKMGFLLQICSLFWITFQSSFLSAPLIVRKRLKLKIAYPHPPVHHRDPQERLIAQTAVSAYFSKFISVKRLNFTPYQQWY